MASNRHLGRIIVLQTLYEIVFRTECGDKTVKIEEVLARNITSHRAVAGDKTFIRQLTTGTDKQAELLDRKLQPLAPDWPLDQIARIDHIVLRMGAYELLNNKEVPPKVVINEAVELAKGFGGENSSKFINGVLGSLLREIDPDSDKKPEPKTTVSENIQSV